MFICSRSRIYHMRITIIITLALLAATSSAQNFSVFNLDATNFPTMRASFYAFDANGNQQYPSSSEIVITENGSARNVISVSCPPAAPAKALSSVLVMDVSGSMSGSNINIAKAAATFWINNMPLGNSECALTSFDDANYFNQDFTTNQKKLADAIAALQAQNGTNYDAGLLDQMAGGLEVTKLAKHQRVIIFLTDGLSSDPQTAAIIAEAKKQNCLIFAVTVGLKCPQCLKDISLQTGGQWFEDVVSDIQILDIYRKIMDQARGQSACTIEWKGFSSCSMDLTSVRFAWGNQSTALKYKAPFVTISKLKFDPLILSIPAKNIGVQFDTEVMITAQNAPFEIINITSTNSLFDINPKAFHINAGQSKKLTVSFTPADSSYAWTQFDIETDQCAGVFNADASFPGYHKPTLKLIKPNGGEVFNAGSDTEITWTGVPPLEKVSLAVSYDKGASWNPITTEATSGRFPWHVPFILSDRCLVKVERDSSPSFSGWSDRAGGAKTDYGNGIVADAIGNVYVTGLFEGTADFGNNTFTAVGFCDIYIAKYNPFGNLEWVNQVSGPDNDVGTAMALDSAGDILVTGWFTGTTNFGNIKVSSPNGGMFIAKYHPDGSVVWVKQANGQGGGRGVASDASGNIYVTGDFYNSINFGGVTLTGSSNGSGFVAKYQSDGKFVWAKLLEGGYTAGRGIAVDRVGNSFVTGEFVGQLKISSATLNDAGGGDIFVAKFLPDGNLDWAKRAGGSDQDWGYSIALDGSGNAYVTGFFVGKASFDAYVLSNKGYNMFLAKLHSDGTTEWVTQAGRKQANARSGGYGIATDASGNSYVTGLFETTTDFGGVTLTSAGNQDIMVAKYRTNGSVEWVKQAGGTDLDRGLAVSLDPAHNIYIAGYFDGQANIGGNIFTEAGGYEDIFVWKIGDDKKESDTSDAVFSIVRPFPVINDVDLGKVLIGSTKDSVVSAFISNAGSLGFRVDSIAIIGADAAQFGLVSGIPPFDVPPGSSHNVEFHFHPTSLGLKWEQLQILVQGDTLEMHISGEGITPTVAVMGNIIDFGQVRIGSYKDTTITIALQNIGSLPITFSLDSQLGPDVKQFLLQSGNTPFTLQPNASQSVTLRFAPRYVGRTSGRIGFYYNGAAGGTPALLSLFGQGLGGAVRIPDDSGYAGDHKNIPMLLEDVPVSSMQSEATNFSARIAYDRSVLYPSTGSIQHGVRYDTVSITGAIGASETLAVLPFVAMLGESTTSPMNIVDFTWLDGSGNPADFDVETESGTFHMLGICPAGGNRLYNPDGKVSIAHVNPNPSNGIIHIDIQTTETGRTQLSLMNLLGQKISSISDGELRPGNHSFDFNTKDLSAGSYFLLLQTPTVRRLERADVEK
jgi:hypothetical protein